MSIIIQKELYQDSVSVEIKADFTQCMILGVTRAEKTLVSCDVSSFRLFKGDACVGIFSIFSGLAWRVVEDFALQGIRCEAPSQSVAC